MRYFVHGWILCSVLNSAHAQDFAVPRCEVLPLPEHQTSLQIDGVEKTRWHFGSQYPRPFFYPFAGPSGVSLTRMGHPGAENHDHHRSIWIAHHKINGIDFWSDNTKATIRQKHWYRYQDESDETVMAVCLGWYDEAGTEVMEQDLIVALRPLPNAEHEMEVQLTFRPAQGSETVSLNQTNFGPLAVRVSKSLSTHFGGGRITNSEGQTGEPEVFGRQARWMDYSGPVIVGTGDRRKVVYEGITYFDHPANPGYPNHWHVRADGWMGAAPCMHVQHDIKAGDQLILRYLLHAHSGEYGEVRSRARHGQFADRLPFQVQSPADKPHLQYDVTRALAAP